MSAKAENFVKTITQWQEDWEQGRGGCPMVEPIVGDGEEFPLKTVNLTRKGSYWEIELTYGPKNDYFELSILSVDGPRVIRRMDSDSFAFESDGEPGRITRAPAA